MLQPATLILLVCLACARAQGRYWWLGTQAFRGVDTSQQGSGTGTSANQIAGQNQDIQLRPVEQNQEIQIQQVEQKQEIQIQQVEQNQGIQIQQVEQNQGIVLQPGQENQ